MSGYCLSCGNTICICNLPEYKGSRPENKENIARLKRIKEATGGVNVLKLSDGDLLFLIESLESEWG